MEWNDHGEILLPDGSVYDGILRITYYETRWPWLAEGLLDDLYREAEDQRHFSATRQIKDYIDAGNGFSMTLDDFANMFFYNKFHLERRFKARFGISLIEYRNQRTSQSARSYRASVFRR